MSRFTPQFITGVFLLSFISVRAQVSTAGDNVALTIASIVRVGTNLSSISMSFAPVTSAGAKIASVTNSSIYLKVSSLVPAGTKRKITARLLSGTIPAGTQLTIQSAASTTSNSGGALGTAVASPIVLSSVDQNLITNIGSCYTGTGSTDGYRITFTWGVTNPATTYGQLRSTTTNPVIVFTVTAPE